MTMVSHPAVQRDFNEALDYYEAEGGIHLADRFEAEFRICIAAVKAGPTRFPFYQRSDRFRRIRLRSFPFLIVYRASAAIYNSGGGILRMGVEDDGKVTGGQGLADYRVARDGTGFSAYPVPSNLVLS